MAERKECFGQLANAAIRYRNQSDQYFLHVDEEKLKECDTCPLFNKCMFLRYNEVFKDMLKLVNEARGSGTGSMRHRLG